GVGARRRIGKYHMETNYVAAPTIRPAGGTLGILTPGLGAVATTFMAGVESIRLADANGDDSTWQADRQSVAADQGLRSARVARQHRVRSVGPDSRRRLHRG